MAAKKKFQRKLPIGVKLIHFDIHKDDRGAFTEIFREEWKTGMKPVQWSVAISQARVLRGFHVHIKHTDYLILLSGHATFAFKDLRKKSKTFGLSCTVDVKGEKLSAFVIPPGVGHGFYFHKPSMHIYSVSSYWDRDDELGCFWADPALGIKWPKKTAHVSRRDATLPLLEELMKELYPKAKKEKKISRWSSRDHLSNFANSSAD